MSSATKRDDILREVEELRQRVAELESREEEAAPGSDEREAAPSQELGRPERELKSRTRQRHRTRQELLRRLSQLATVAQLGWEALEGQSLDRLMDRAVQAAAKALQVPFCKILQVREDGRSLRLRSGTGWKRGRVGSAVVPGDAKSQAGYTLLSKSPVVVEDLSRETRFKAPELLVEHGVVSGVSVAIFRHEKPWGILGAHDSRRRRFEQGDVRFLQSVANVLSSAIERLQAERTLARSEKRTRAILETVVDGIISINERGVIQSLNDSALRIFGYRRDELIGANVSKLMPEPDARRHDEYIRRYLQTGEAHIIGYGREVLGKRKDGSTFPLHLGVGEVRLGEERMFVGVVRDLTEQKRMQEQLLQAESLAGLGEMAASVAHEIKNPLAAISGVISILKENNAVGPPYDEVFEELAGRVSLLDKTVRRLLLFAKPWQPQLQNVDLCEFARHMADSASRMEAFQGVDVRIEADGAIRAPLDLVLVEDVFWNLLHNAAEAMPEGGGVEISVQARDQVARVEVRDEGVGIPEENLDKLFRPFFTTKSRGTGLGLAICQKIVNMHGGAISAQSEEGQGSTIILEFPMG